MLPVEKVDTNTAGRDVISSSVYNHPSYVVRNVSEIPVGEWFADVCVLCPMLSQPESGVRFFL